jgi:hypothetical protein
MKILILVYYAVTPSGIVYSNEVHILQHRIPTTSKQSGNLSTNRVWNWADISWLKINIFNKLLDL